MSKTFVTPDFLTKFLEERREMPVRWEVCSADYSNRTKQDEAWDLLMQLTREKIPEIDLCFVKKRWIVSEHHLGKICAEFGIVREVVCLRMMSTSQHCATSTCFCSWQTKIFLGKAKAIWKKKLKMLIGIHKKPQL
jgi:hypothetical protein